MDVNILEALAAPVFLFPTARWRQQFGNISTYLPHQVVSHPRTPKPQYHHDNSLKSRADLFTDNLNVRVAFPYTTVMLL
jgi:hypothetical protein